MLPVPSSIDTSELADWAELICLAQRPTRLSKSEVFDQLKRYDVGGLEERTELIWSELFRRSKALGETYPFVVESAAVSRRAAWTQYSLYSMLLSLAAANQFSQTKIQRFNDISRLFETLTTLAVAKYIGGNAL